MNIAAIHAEAPEAHSGIRRRSPLWAFGVVAAATAAGGWWFTSHQYGGPDGLRQRLSGIKVVIANPVIDTGKAEVGDERKFVFKVRNCSNRSVRLLGIRTRCTCVAIESALPTEVSAGAWCEVAGRLYPTATGRQERLLDLYTDEPTAPVIRGEVAIIGRTKLD